MGLNTSSYLAAPNRARPSRYTARVRASSATRYASHPSRFGPLLSPACSSDLNVPMDLDASSAVRAALANPGSAFSDSASTRFWRRYRNASRARTDTNVRASSSWAVGGGGGSFSRSATVRRNTSVRRASGSGESLPVRSCVATAPWNRRRYMSRSYPGRTFRVAS
jgi:hypothetical protein